MTNDAKGDVARIRVFGSLRALLAGQGRPYRFEQSLPEGGVPGAEIAAAFDLPLDRIEAVFRNGRIQGIEEKVFPGDRIAFVPTGTPGPYRVLLGMVGASRASARVGGASRGEEDEDGAPPGDRRQQ